MQLTMKALEARLNLLEAEKCIRETMNSYMRLCDCLGEGFDLDPLMNLFTEGAVWEGSGGRYSKTFGRYAGIEEIRMMFAKYIKSPAHFVTNVHFLTNELINVSDGSARGSWLLLQPSTFSSGKSQLSAAKISVEFEQGEDGHWRMNKFQTESMFSRPVIDPWDNTAPLPVPE